MKLVKVCFFFFWFEKALYHKQMIILERLKVM